MENNQEIPLPKGYTQVSKEESVPLPKGYTEVLDETTPDVKKKEQTKPTQAAPLPGLGGVSEEPTPSPSVGQGVLRNVDRNQPKYFQDLLTTREKRKRKSPQEEELLMAQRNAEADFYLAEKNNNVISSKIESISNTINSEISKKQDELQRAINEGKDVDEANKELEDFVGSMNDKFSELIDSDEEIQQERKNIESQINKELEGKMSDIHKRHYKEQDFFTGYFGAALKAMDLFTPLGIGDVIDDFGRAVLGTGRAQAEGAETGFDMLFAGSEASDEEIQAMLTSSKKLEEQGPSQEMFDYQNTYEEYKEKGKPVVGVIMGLVENPTVALEVMLSSLSGMFNEESVKAAGVIVASGTATGATAGTFITPGIGTAGGAVAGFKASLPYAMSAAGTTMETGLSYSEFLREEIESLNEEEGKNYGYDLEGVRAILNNEERLANVQRRTALRGGSIALIDFLTARMATGLGSKLLKRGASRVGTTIATSAVEGVGGSLGEFTAMKLSGQDVDVSEVALEGIGEGPSGVVAAITEMSKSSTYKVNGESVSKEFIDDLIRTSDPMELAAADIKINNDEKRFSQLEEKKKDAEILESIDESIQGENRQRIFELEKERQKIESKKIKLQSNKKRLSEINSEIDSIVESQKDTVPAKQKGRLTKFSTPQDGIVGEVIYDGTRKELTQEEYDALEKQEGLFDVETGTQPVAETTPTEKKQEIQEKERGFFGKILDKVFKDKKIDEDVQLTEEQKEQGIQEIYDKKVKRIEDNIKEYQETGDTILENLYREELEILKSESPRQYLERDLEVLKGMPNYYSEKASKKDAVSYNKQLVQESVDEIYQTEKLLGITATEQEVKERQDIINSTPTKAELEAQQDTVPVAETPVEETVSESETNKVDVQVQNVTEEETVKARVYDSIFSSKLLTKDEKSILWRQYSRGVMSEADVLKFVSVDLEVLNKKDKPNKWEKVVISKLRKNKDFNSGEYIEFEDLLDETAPQVEEGTPVEETVSESETNKEREIAFEGKRGQADSITFDGRTIKQGEEIELNDVNTSQDDSMPDLRNGTYKVRMLSVDANGKTATLTLTDGNEVITTTVKDLRQSRSNKQTQDAIQEQAAGKVPVQPESKAGEKVEEGKPKTEAEKPTQEGKEVSEEEKVKAAKDKLNSAWGKWKQSQKNLGIAFDPKSKANEDMELLEAFLTYIKALGIKTAKDIQKAFNDFTGGEATLDDVGAEFIANKVNPKKGETNYEKTEDMNRKDLSKRGKSLFNAAKNLFMDFRRTFVKFSSDTRELLKSTTDIRPVYDYFVARLGSPGNANLIFQEAKKKIYDGIFPNLRKHLDSLIKYRRIITINESRVESNRKGLGSLKASEIFEKAGDEAVNAFNEAVSVANDYANSTEQQALDARGIRNEALRSLRQSEWYKSLSELKQKRFEKQLREDIGFLKNENFTGKDSNGNPIGLSVAREMLSEIEVVVGKKDFNKINERAELYFDEFKKMLEKDLKKGIISQEQYDAMIGKDYSPRVFIQHMFGFDGEFIENIDEARLMKEYSLSSDAIRTLREGLKDLNTNEAYWELITDSEKLLAGYISSRERRYAFNDLNKKMVSVLSKFEAEFNELKKKDKLTKEERLRYKKLGNILDAFSTERKRGMSSANYYENGEKKSFYIRDDIFKQWYDMRSTVRPDGTATKLLDNLFQIPQRILQSFATGEAAPFFFVFNTARDFVQLSVISDVYGNWTFTPISMAKAMKDFAKGAYHIFMDDALYREAMENGVGMDFLYMEKGLGLRKMMKDSLLKLAEKSDITRVGSMALTKGLDAMSSGLTAANRYSELGFRIAIYERVRDAEYKKIEAAKDKMTDEEYLEAKQDARKKAAAVSRDFMNFSEGGSFTKKVNPYASYLNAAVIGTDTVVKEFRKNPPAFTFRVAQGTTILSTAMLGMGLMMLNMFDEDDEEEGDDKDKQYGTLKKYYKILDSVSPYYRNKFYIIPTGRKDENGNYEVIRIAKNPALIPISYAAEKALRYNLEKQLLGSEERYSSENLKKDALEINYLFHEYVMPINLSPVDENGDTGLGLVSNLAQKNIPLSLMIITMTGYDPYTNRYISPEKKYQSELDSKYLIGWNDPEIQGFYKDMAMELNTSITPKEMKVMVEKVITRPENNPIIASVYSMLDRNNKTSDIIKKDRSLVSDILKMTKKVAVISADYEEYAKKPKTKKIEEKIREHKEEKYVISKITKTVLNDIIEKVKDGKIDALDADGVIDEMNKMVSTQIDVFKEADVEVSEKDENEIRHKIYRNAVPVLKLPQLPTQYKLAYVVDKDPVVMAYRFFEDFGDVDVNDRQFIEISAQMMNEYTAQYNSKMSKDKFSEFLNKYIEAKNDPELIGN